MRNRDEWHLDDEGRLHRAMKAHDKARTDWVGMPVATTRGAKAADRILDGIVVTCYFTAAALAIGFALVTLGYIETPVMKNSKPAVTAPTLPDTGTDACGK